TPALSSACCISTDCLLSTLPRQTLLLSAPFQNHPRQRSGPPLHLQQQFCSAPAALWLSVFCSSQTQNTGVNIYLSILGSPQLICLLQTYRHLFALWHLLSLVGQLHLQLTHSML